MIFTELSHIMFLVEAPFGLPQITSNQWLPYPALSQNILSCVCRSKCKLIEKCKLIYFLFAFKKIIGQKKVTNAVWTELLESFQKDISEGSYIQWVAKEKKNILKTNCFSKRQWCLSQDRSHNLVLVEPVIHRSNPIRSMLLSQFYLCLKKIFLYVK